MEERGKSIAANLYVFSRPSKAAIWACAFIPRGVIRDNQLRQNQYIDEVLERINSVKQEIDLDRATPSSFENITGTYEQYHYLIGQATGGSYGEIEKRYIRLQTLLDEARLACALERFRAAHQTYPESLKELIPEFIATLPTDIYSRAPYRYQRLGEDAFRLYGVGANRTDEGGKLMPGVYESVQLDAVWPYAPATTKESGPIGH
jgi:hypothetical protein